MVLMMVIGGSTFVSGARGGRLWGTLSAVRVGGWVLVISDQADNVLQKEIGQYFVLHEESIGKLSNYLGGKLKLPLKMKLKLKLLAQLNTCSTCCLLLRMSRTI